MGRAFMRWREMPYGGRLIIPAASAQAEIIFPVAVDRLVFMTYATVDLSWLVTSDPTVVLSAPAAPANPSSPTPQAGHSRSDLKLMTVLEVAGGGNRWLFIGNAATTLVYTGGIAAYPAD